MRPLSNAQRRVSVQTKQVVNGSCLLLCHCLLERFPHRSPEPDQPWQKLPGQARRSGQPSPPSLDDSAYVFRPAVHAQTALGREILGPGQSPARPSVDIPPSLLKTGVGSTDGGRAAPRIGRHPRDSISLASARAGTSHLAIYDPAIAFSLSTLRLGRAMGVIGLTRHSGIGRSSVSFTLLCGSRYAALAVGHRSWMPAPASVCASGEWPNASWRCRRPECCAAAIARRRANQFGHFGFPSLLILAFQRARRPSR